MEQITRNAFSFNLTGGIERIQRFRGLTHETL